MAVVLLSGGLDSTVLLAAVLEDDAALAVSFDYGQRHRLELAAAANVAGKLRADHLVLRVDRQAFAGAGSALIDGPLDPGPYDLDGPTPAYVPNRNAVLISLAVAVALARGHDAVWYGAHAEDAHRFAYPDTTPEFNGAMSAAVYVGTNVAVRLRVPFQWTTKDEIVKLGLALDAPLELTLSCYAGRRPACGECASCLARLAAFARAGQPDPIDYVRAGG